MSQDPYTVYRKVARLGSVLLLLLGILVLLGWSLNIALLTGFLPGGMAMKPNTAVAFLFLGTALFLLTLTRKTRSTQLCCAAFAGAAIWGFGASLGFPVGMSAAADDPRRAALRLSVVSTIGYGAFLCGPPLNTDERNVELTISAIEKTRGVTP